MTTPNSVGSTVPLRAKLDELWLALLKRYPDGVSNTSTSKYDDIRKWLADTLSVQAGDVYVTGASSGRTSNLDTRFVQGNQAGRHTRVGVGVIQKAANEDELDKISNSAVVTSKKFVNGEDITVYDTILIFVELSDQLRLTKVIQPASGGLFDVLEKYFPEAKLEITGLRAIRAPAQEPAAPTPIATEKLPSNLIDEFVSASTAAGAIIKRDFAARLVSALLAKRFVLLTGLAGSGKTKLAQALARWITPSHLDSDPFLPGAMLAAARKTYKVSDADRLGVEFLSDEGTKVLLPRAIIEQWADYVEQNDVPDTIGAQELRDQIKATGGEYSAYLQNFETHYKPAAFALLKSRANGLPAQCYEVVPVGADWTGNENILGYPDGLQATHYVSKPALELILQAADHPNTPHFLILDEMNLSHVERYFADVLSCIESDEGLELYSGDINKPETWRNTSAAKSIPPKLKELPQNLFIIGTVNVDETTYMFSPKVLDRANVIEFRMDASELAHFLVSPTRPDLSKLDGKGVAFGEDFVEAARNTVVVPSEVKATYDAEMLLLFSTMQVHGAEFGYRTAYETARFLHFYKLLGSYPDGDASWFSGAFDCVVLQKLLPKLHGSRAKLGPVLRKLWFFCVNDAEGRGENPLKAADDAARSSEKKADPSVVPPVGAPYPMSAEKIGRMWRLLSENGFASFAEA